MDLRFCPLCATPLTTRIEGGATRQACPDAQCGYVHWNNPVPVVAAVVEHEGQIVLARNRAWQVPFYALITGFLEKSDASAEAAVMREVGEELGLEAQAAHYIGHYSFARLNQIILAFHVPATGVIQLNEELADVRCIAPEKVQYWPAATGLALRDFLIRQGHQPQEMQVPRL